MSFSFVGKLILRDQDEKIAIPYIDMVAIFIQWQ